SSLGKMDKRAPFALTQAEGAQTLIELRPPGAGGAEENESELVDIWTRHVRKLVSMLTNRIPQQCQTDGNSLSGERARLARWFRRLAETIFAIAAGDRNPNHPLL